MPNGIDDAPLYEPPIALGNVMVGGTVSRVIASEHHDFQANDLVLGFAGWQQYHLSDGKGLTKLDASIPHASPDIGRLKTVVVAAASQFTE